MTDEVLAEKKRKRMLGFYIGMGAVALLLVGFHFAWTPLRVWYWERQVLRAAIDSDYVPLGLPPYHFMSPDAPCTKAAIELVKLGPPARPAVSRLLRLDDTQRRLTVLYALRRAGGHWCLPLLVTAAQDQDVRVSYWAVPVACQISGHAFFYSQDEPHKHKIDSLMSWWERKGKAKYGSGE